MEKKQNMLMFFKRVGKKGSWRSRFGSSGFRWKKRCNIFRWFVDRFIFKIVSVFEAIALVSTLCFFFLCCGCNF